MIDVSISPLSVSDDNLQRYYFHKHHDEMEAHAVLHQDYWESWSAFDEMRSHLEEAACSQKNA